VVTFFVSNLTEDCHYLQLKEEFQTYGKLVHVYAPRKKDKWGNYFAFVRFANIRDVHEMEKTLSMIKLGHMKIWVNEAKFDPDNNPTPYFKPALQRGRNQQGPVKTRQNVIPQRWEKVDKGVSFKDKLMGGNHENQDRKIIHLHPKETNFHIQFKGKAVIAKVINLLTHQNFWR
jgi:RNA recognition motif-containing protein